MGGPTGVKSGSNPARFLAEAPQWAKAVGGLIVFIGVLLSVLVGLGIVRPIPNVYGFDGSDAYNRLVAAGFAVQQIDTTSASVPAGKVIRTDPPGEANALRSSTVKLYVSTGPTATPPPQSSPSPSPPRSPVTAADIVISPTMLDWSPLGVPYGVSKSVHVANNSKSSPATINQLQVTGDSVFTIEASSSCKLGAQLGPGEGCDVVVTFRADLSDSHGVYLSIGTTASGLKFISLTFRPAPVSGNQGLGPYTYTGLWINDNPSTNSIVRVDISRSDNTLIVHVFGACTTDSPCDWGSRTVTYIGDPVVVDFPSSAHRLTIVVNKTGTRLQVMVDQSDFQQFHAY